MLLVDTLMENATETGLEPGYKQVSSTEPATNDELSTTTLY